MNSADQNKLLQNIHWTSSEEMLFTAENKYELPLPENFPFRIQFYQFTAAHPVIPNYHDFYEISYFYSGGGYYYIADQRLDVQTGSIVFIQAGQMHNMQSDTNDEIKSASIYFMPELIFHAGAHTFESSFLLPFQHQTGKKTPVLQDSDLDFSYWELVLQMYQTLLQKQNYYQLDLKNELSRFLLNVLQKVQYDEFPPDDSTPMHKVKRLNHVFQVIQQEYANELSVQDLADVAAMSTSYFCRYFKQVTGLSPVNYILRFRIDKSKELLLHSDSSITEISFQVGFNSQSYFDRIFQRFTKMSPNQFRQTFISPK